MRMTVFGALRARPGFCILFAEAIENVLTDVASALSLPVI